MIKMVVGSDQYKNNFVRNKIIKLIKKDKKVLLIDTSNYFDYLITFSKSLNKKNKYIRNLDMHLSMDKLSPKEIVKIINKKYRKHDVLFLDLDFILEDIPSIIRLGYIYKRLKALKIKECYITSGAYITTDIKKFLKSIDAGLVSLKKHKSTTFEISNTLDFKNILGSDIAKCPEPILTE